MLTRRIYIIEGTMSIVMLLTLFGWHYIREIAKQSQSYVWILLSVSLVVIAITYMLTVRISKESVILSSE